MTLTNKEQELLKKYRKLTAEQKKNIDNAIEAAQKTHYDLKTAAGLIGVTYRTTQDYISAGKLKAHKIGGKWAISADDLNDFINGRA